MALFCVISANSGSFRAHCVKVHVRYLISWWVLVEQLPEIFCVKNASNSLRGQRPTEDRRLSVYLELRLAVVYRHAKFRDNTTMFTNIKADIFKTPLLPPIDSKPRTVIIDILVSYCGVGRRTPLHSVQSERSTLRSFNHIRDISERSDFHLSGLSEQPVTHAQWLLLGRSFISMRTERMTTVCHVTVWSHVLIFVAWGIFRGLMTSSGHGHLDRL